MEFRKYLHVEKFGNDEVQGIELGECYIFPKIDGTNGSVWMDGGETCAGSRNRQLSIDSDNAGFLKWLLDERRFFDFLCEFPNWRIYGEWLVPHSLKTYREDAWRDFYVFDVWDEEREGFVPYDEYQEPLDRNRVTYIPPICTLKNAAYDSLLKELDNNLYLIEDGKGVGEGIVIKNYNYQNKYGRTTWAKMVTNTFKEKPVHAMGAPNKLCKQMVEQDICDNYIDKPLVDKVYAKIVTEMEGWSSKYIPRLLSTVYYDLVNEEMWNAVKKMKNPTVNFKTLNTLVIMKTKELRPELF